jgi:shikimate kinase/3-dehydroquinate synthase
MSASPGSRSRPRSIALVGLPGSGKSTLATRLADRLGWELHDTDLVITSSSGRTPREIIETEGEAAFRKLELTAVHDLLRRSRPGVIACGGGLFAEEAARRRLLEAAWVVALDAPDSILAERVGDAADRPLLRGDVAGRLTELRRRRAPSYAEAHVRLDTARLSIEAAVAEMAALGDSVCVNAGDFTYPVVVGDGAADHLEIHLPEASRRVAVVIDAGVAPFGRRIAGRIGKLDRAVTAVELEGGEKVKSWAGVSRLLETFARFGMGRRDAVVAVGGGALSDLTGYAAAAYCRGIAWIVVPTTLLAMVDSAIGGKTGVNLRAAKNLAGAFWQPLAVLADPTVLDTLPERQVASGMVEVGKYAMIANTDLPALLDGGMERALSGDVHALTAIIERCAAIKAEVVAEDPREAGRRAILNYGHTAGHAIEAATGYGPVTHGEAVAAGMRIAGRLSAQIAGLPVADLDWQERLLDRLRLRELPAIHPQAVLRRLGHDKKADGGEPRWVLLSRRGEPRINQRVPETLVRDTLSKVLAGRP